MLLNELITANYGMQAYKFFHRLAVSKHGNAGKRIAKIIKGYTASAL